MIKLSAKELTEEDNNRISQLMLTIGDFERIGDHALYMLQIAEKLKENEKKLSQLAIEELKVIVHAVTEIYLVAFEAYKTDNIELAKEVEALEAVIKKNREFHKLGLKVMIYVPSKTGFRPPMYEGLPTVENHRYLPLEAILSQIKYLEADEVFFGDAYASSEELDLLTKFNYNIPVIPVVIKKGLDDVQKELLLRNHHNRPDETGYFKRSSIRSKVEVNEFNAVDRKKYDVTIDNKGFLRYQGEVCIMCTDLEKDQRVNVVGRALIDEDVLNAIKPGKGFRIKIVGEENE
jgi:hypothetical protein